MTRLVAVLVAAALLSPTLALANDPHQGWTYLIDRLVSDGLDPARVTRVFDDPRMDPFDGLEFGLNPRESHALYRAFLRPPSLAAARRCRREHADEFQAAERTTGVSANVVAAVLHVETGCGRNTGSSPVVYRLARLAMANEPKNLELNMERLAGDDPSLERQVKARAQYLEDIFYPEVRAVFELSDRLRVDPLELRGSGSGAFGAPQFLPTSYLRFGMDGSGDGRVDLFDLGDASASCANYLAAQGWKSGLTDKQRRAVIWRYNRSEAYVSTVLTLARSLDGKPIAVASSRRKKAPARATASKARKAPKAKSAAKAAPKRVQPVRTKAVKRTKAS